MSRIHERTTPTSEAWRASVAAAVATLLTSTSLTAVLSGAAWVSPIVVVTLVAALGGAAARWLRLPAALHPLAGLVLLIPVLTAMFTPAAATLLVLPGPGALRGFVALLHSGAADIQTSASPAYPAPGILAITALGVAAVAIAVQTLAVGYATPAAAGLPLLALNAVPGAISRHGGGAVPFVAAALGYLGMLAVAQLSATQHWGPAASATPRADAPPVRADGLLASARKVGLAALVLAVVAPAWLPGLDRGLLPVVLEGRFGHGPGSSTVAVVNPILDIRADLNQPQDATLLSYTTDAATPAYLRTVTLDEFDGNVWSPMRLQVPNAQNLSNGLPRPPGLGSQVGGTPVHTRIQVGALAERWLPLPYPAVAVQASGLWLYDTPTFNVFSTQRTTANLVYDVTSLQLVLTPAALAGAKAPGPGPGASTGLPLTRDLRLPAGFPDSVRLLAQQVTAAAVTDYDKAVALQAWLRDPARFTYDTHAPDGSGTSAIEAFLVSRRGFCVQFASTMAVMARSLGIPARVDVGFLPGQQVAPGSYVVRTHDAHAWPELYFSGIGWVPFEPTPAVRTGAAPGYTQGGAGGAQVLPGTTPAVTAPTGPTSGPSASAGALAPKLNDLRDPRGLPGRTGAGLPWPLLVLVSLGAGLVGSPGVLRSLLRRRRLGSSGSSPAERAGQAWVELRDSALDLGYPWPPSRTPRQSAEEIGRQGGLDEPAREALGRLSMVVERARYAPVVGPVTGLREDVTTVRTALAQRRSARTRLRALLWPASLYRLRRGWLRRG